MSGFVDKNFIRSIYTVQKFRNCVGHCDLAPVACFT